MLISCNCLEIFSRRERFKFPVVITCHLKGPVPKENKSLITAGTGRFGSQSQILGSKAFPEFSCLHGEQYSCSLLDMLSVHIVGYTWTLPSSEHPRNIGEICSVLWLPKNILFFQHLVTGSSSDYAIPISTSFIYFLSKNWSSLCPQFCICLVFFQSCCCWSISGKTSQHVQICLP